MSRRVEDVEEWKLVSSLFKSSSVLYWWGKKKVQCVCLSWRWQSILGVLSDCLTDNPSHSQCVWQEEVSVSSLSLSAAHTEPMKESRSFPASPGTTHTQASLEGMKAADWRRLGVFVYVKVWKRERKLKEQSASKYILLGKCRWKKKNNLVHPRESL